LIPEGLWVVLLLWILTETIVVLCLEAPSVCIFFPWVYLVVVFILFFLWLLVDSGRSTWAILKNRSLLFCCVGAADPC